MFRRDDRSYLARWWWTVDFWLLGALGLLVGVGMMLLPTASPATARLLGQDSFFFFSKQLTLLPVALAALLCASALGVKGVVRFSAMLLLAATVGLALTAVVGNPLKGASRWLELGGFTLQPSEFFKPAFAVVSAYLFCLTPGLKLGAREAPGWAWALALSLVGAFLCLLQPDLGQALIILAIWGCQFLVAGASLWFIPAFCLIGSGGGLAAYYFFPHAKARVNSFFSEGGSYQVERSMEAFAAGGFLGRGPGEGVVKTTLPDSHSDFIFAVAAEEFGLFACLAIMALLLFIAVRPLIGISAAAGKFIILAGCGLVTNFALQALLNLASTSGMMPPKGITLPFVSYGGSAFLAMALNMGLLLALVRSANADEPEGRR